MQIKRKVPIAIERYALDGAILALMVLLYVPVLWHWVHGWLFKSISIQHEYFSHGLIGLPFAAYIVWTQRSRWRQLPDVANPWGGALLLIGAVFYLSGMTDLMSFSLPLMLTGLCLWLKGFAGLRLQGFPLLLVLLATPNQIPYLLEPYTLPLQQFIAGMAGFLLLQFGVNVQVDQIYLFVNGNFSSPVEVAPYCAGLKMLFTSLYVALMLLYWTGAWTSRTKSLLFLGGVVGISISANIIRNTALTYFHGTGKEAAFHWLHEDWGGDVYSAFSLVALIFLLRFIDQLIPDAASEPPPAS
jgi:cyanoexosortase B